LPQNNFEQICEYSLKISPLPNKKLKWPKLLLLLSLQKQLLNMLLKPTSLPFILNSLFPKLQTSSKSPLILIKSNTTHGLNCSNSMPEPMKFSTTSSHHHQLMPHLLHPLLKKPIIPRGTHRCHCFAMNLWHYIHLSCSYHY